MDTDRRPHVPAPGPDGPAPISPAPDRPLGELFRSLGRDAAALVRQEFVLAKAEIRQNLRALARDAVMVMLGAVFALLGLLVLLAALVLFVGDLMGDRYALGALVVGVVLLAIGGGLALLGVKKAREASLAPETTLATLRDTGDWARTEAQDIRATLTGDAARPANGAAVAHRSPRRRIAADSARPDGPSAREQRVDARAGPRLPADAPLWKRVFREFKRDDVPGQAARVAFYFFLSLPPAIMALFALTGLFGGAGTADWLTQQLTTSLPGEAAQLVSGFVDDVVHNQAPGPLSFGLLGALWAGSSVFTALEDTLNQAYDVTQERSFVKKKAIAVGMLLACAVLFLIGSAVLLAGGSISGALGLGDFGRTVWGILQVPLGFLLITCTFWLIYYVLPNRDQSACKGTLFKASAISAGLFVAAALAFRLYIANFGSYSATYGLLGTIIVLLLWMYVTSLVILLGGEVASEMERGARKSS